MNSAGKGPKLPSNHNSQSGKPKNNRQETDCASTTPQMRFQGFSVQDLTTPGTHPTAPIDQHSSHKMEDKKHVQEQQKEMHKQNYSANASMKQAEEHQKLQQNTSLDKNITKICGLKSPFATKDTVNENVTESRIAQQITDQAITEITKLQNQSSIKNHTPFNDLSQPSSAMPQTNPSTPSSSFSAIPSNKSTGVVVDAMANINQTTSKKDCDLALHSIDKNQQPSSTMQDSKQDSKAISDKTASEESALPKEAETKKKGIKDIAEKKRITEEEELKQQYELFFNLPMYLENNILCDKDLKALGLVLQLIRLEKNQPVWEREYYAMMYCKPENYGIIFKHVEINPLIMLDQAQSGDFYVLKFEKFPNAFLELVAENSHYILLYPAYKNGIAEYYLGINYSTSAENKYKMSNHAIFPESGSKGTIYHYF